MTITSRHAHRQVTASTTILVALAPRIRDGIDRAATLIADGGDRGGPEDAKIRGKNWISDPTSVQALGRMAATERVLDDIETALDTLRLTTALLVAWCEEHAPVIADHPRCTGGRTVDEWTRPGCTGLVDYSRRTDGSVSYRTDGLCVACRSAKQRYEAKREAEVAA